jgi:hypothetical protein
LASPPEAKKPLVVASRALAEDLRSWRDSAEREVRVEREAEC